MRSLMTGGFLIAALALTGNAAMAANTQVHTSPKAVHVTQPRVAARGCACGCAPAVCLCTCSIALRHWAIHPVHAWRPIAAAICPDRPQRREGIGVPSGLRLAQFILAVAEL